MAAPAIIMGFISRKGVQKAIEKYGRAAVRKAQQASKKVDDALDKAQGVKPSSPGRRTDSAIIGISFVEASLFSFLVAPQPSKTGKLRSIKIISGFSFWAASTPACPSLAMTRSKFFLFKRRDSI